MTDTRDVRAAAAKAAWDNLRAQAEQDPDAVTIQMVDVGAIAEKVNRERLARITDRATRARREYVMVDATEYADTVEFLLDQLHTRDETLRLLARALAHCNLPHLKATLPPMSSADLLRASVLVNELAPATSDTTRESQ